MSTTPTRYQPDPRLIDQPAQLRKLYEDDDLTVREIADRHAEVGRTAVSEALQEYGITDGESETATETPHTDSEPRGLAPPQSGGARGAEWTQIQD